MSKKIGMLGTDMVEQVLASGYLKYGRAVEIAIRTPDRVADRLDNNPNGTVGTHKDVAAWAEFIVLAAKGSATEITIRLRDAADPVGKIIIDTTNPIADAPPDNGVLRYFTTMDESLMEQLQKPTRRPIS